MQAAHQKYLSQQLSLVLTVLSLSVAGLASGIEEPSGDQSREVLAVLIPMEGDAWVISGAAKRKPVRPQQAVTERDRLELGDDARVVLVCANTVVREIKKSIWLSAETCQDLLRVERPMPSPGGLRLWRGSLVVGGWARGDRDDIEHRPFIVAPRCPRDSSKQLGCGKLLDRSPQLRWLAVAGAERYVLELSRANKILDQVNLGPSEAVCAPSDLFNGRPVCSSPWPSDAWTMDDADYSFKVVALTRSLATRSGVMLLRPLPAAQEGMVHKALKRVERHGLDSESTRLAQATILTGLGLFHDAAELLAPRPGREPATVISPYLALALGDTSLHIDLPEQAAASYHKVLELTARPDLQGLAQLGLARAMDMLADEEQTICHYHRSRRLLQQAGLREDERVATEAIADILNRWGVACLKDLLR